MKKKFDPSVYFVADPAACEGRDLADIIARAVRGGVSMVQYRDKSGDMALITEQARRIQTIICEESDALDRHIAFLINDHVEIARDIQADGVHLGQGDGDPVAARHMLGADKIIGWTAFTPAHFEALQSMPPGTVDYVGTGPVYPTPTKTDKPVIGPEGLAKLIKLSPVPVVGIGGITPDNAASVIDSGACGVAMMRAISAADGPETAAQKFRQSAA